MGVSVRIVALFAVVFWATAWLPTSARSLPQTWVVDADELGAAAVRAPQGNETDWVGSGPGALPDDPDRTLPTAEATAAPPSRVAWFVPRPVAEPGLPRGPPAVG